METPDYHAATVPDGEADLGWSLADLAAQSGISKPMLQRFEAGSGA
ncbi:helix-turn-helix domain-containing protein [Pelagerythrobacter marinus]